MAHAAFVVNMGVENIAAYKVRRLVVVACGAGVDYSCIASSHAPYRRKWQWDRQEPQQAEGSAAWAVRRNTGGGGGRLDGGYWRREVPRTVASLVCTAQPLHQNPKLLMMRARTDLGDVRAAAALVRGEFSGVRGCQLCAGGAGRRARQLRRACRGRLGHPGSQGARGKPLTSRPG